MESKVDLMIIIGMVEAAIMLAAIALDCEPVVNVMTVLLFIDFLVLGMTAQCLELKKHEKK